MADSETTTKKRGRPSKAKPEAEPEVNDESDEKKEV